MKRISLSKAFDHLSKDPVMSFLIGKFSERIDWGNRFDENYAKSNKIGMWAMRFEFPWDWRRKN